MRKTTGNGRSDLGPTDRTVAAVLALVWLAVGGLAIVLGMERGYWVAVALGIPAIAYGMLWVMVALTGRRLQRPKHRR